MRRRRHIVHGPRRLWTQPWRRVCRCGVAAWPCPVLIRAAARPPANERPGWDAPTRNVPVAPLLTRGQAARARQGSRR